CSRGWAKTDLDQW
nr:immunoglobulin heavy chain junction region [Macaca mulatta]MOV86843.1 immunoglobulin heavy chain junction region [Macaca mulatta]MOV86935.1 immunoglobulin heavy chain junction region [Macaca mulatta]MOV87072.1 immunoglobulin heavy chain junction region [Macaca mulatta]MOV87191.1 immunoglobulin heavy chain junction region [Macaca mulatta]